MEESTSITTSLPGTTKYWVIAPFDVRDPSWQLAWNFCFNNGLMAIGWTKLDDLSGASEDVRRARVEAVFPNYPKATVTWLVNTFRKFLQRH
jgi:hypothetical protein